MPPSFRRDDDAALRDMNAYEDLGMRPGRVNATDGEVSRKTLRRGRALVRHLLFAPALHR